MLFAAMQIFVYIAKNEEEKKQQMFALELISGFSITQFHFLNVEFWTYGK